MPRHFDSKFEQHWNHVVYVEQRDRDIVALMKREAKPGGLLYLLPAKKIASQLRKTQLSYLIPEISKCLV